MDAIGLRTEVDGAKYTRLRFTSMSAQILRPNAGKGRLVINVDISLKNAEGADVKVGEYRYVSGIKVQLFGVPHDVAEDADAISKAAFRVEVDLIAIVSWEKEPTEALKNSTDCAARIARPLYMLAATEVRALASKLGFNGLNFDVDLQNVLANPANNIIDARGPHLKKTAAKNPSIKKPAVKKAAVKRVLRNQ